MVPEDGGEFDASAEDRSERIQHRLTDAGRIAVRIDVVAQQHQGVEGPTGVLVRHGCHGLLELG